MNKAHLEFCSGPKAPLVCQPSSLQQLQAQAGTQELTLPVLETRLSVALEVRDVLSLAWPEVLLPEVGREAEWHQAWPSVALVQSSLA